MSMFYKENGRSWDPTLDVAPEKRSRAKQAFKDECDINMIVKRMARGQTISHLAKHSGRYGDFTDFPDLLEAQRRLSAGRQIFEELPVEIKREFGNNPSAFFSFVNDPANADKLEEVLPALAAPGDQFRKNPLMRREASSPTGADPVPAPTPPAGDGDSSSGAA